MSTACAFVPKYRKQNNLGTFYFNIKSVFRVRLSLFL